MVGFFVTSEVFDSSAKETTNWPAPSQTTLNCCNAVLQASTARNWHALLMLSSLSKICKTDCSMARDPPPSFTCAVRSSSTPPHLRWVSLDVLQHRLLVRHQRAQVLHQLALVGEQLGARTLGNPRSLKMETERKAASGEYLHFCIEFRRCELDACS